MRWLLPLVALSCAPEPDLGDPTSHGTLLYADNGEVVVRHDDPIGVTVTGPRVYAAADGLRLPDPGAHVDLWVGDGTITALQVTGTDPLPPTFRADGWPVEGTVVRKDGPRVTVDHGPIEGLMGPMVMTFRVGESVDVVTGDRISGRLIATGTDGYVLVGVERTGTGEAGLREDVKPLAAGDEMPAIAVPVAPDGTMVIGAGQDEPTLVTFIYTTCPDPAFCPATVSRLQSLQAQIDSSVRILAVTIDPEHDRLPVLADYAALVGADPEIWRFGRLDPVDLQQLALLSGLSVTLKGGRIAHNVRILVLDADGRLVERYDDNEYPLERVVEQLNTGSPRG